jgi:hypothetical protein
MIVNRLTKFRTKKYKLDTQYLIRFRRLNKRVVINSKDSQLGEFLLD